MIILQNCIQTNAICVYFQIARYIWCIADRQSGGKSKLEIAEANEEGEEWTAIAPRVTRRFREMQDKDRAAHALRLCLPTLRDAAGKSKICRSTNQLVNCVQQFRNKFQFFKSKIKK